MNTFQLTEETWVDQGRDGDTSTLQQGGSQKFTYALLLLMVILCRMH